MHQKELRRLLEAQAIDVRDALPDVMRPSAVSVGLAGITRLQRGEIAGQGLAPLYVQRAEAEVVWERKGAVSPLAKARRRPFGRKARIS
jgi:tRNA threonylcarbamoyladenosine biosynthesis protein TsaB